MWLMSTQVYIIYMFCAIVLGCTFCYFINLNMELHILYFEFVNKPVIE